MDIDKLEHAVDQARIQSYAQFGKVLDIDANQFATLMAKDLGIDIPGFDDPQPPTEVVPPALTADTQPATEEEGGDADAVDVPDVEDTDAAPIKDYIPHVFRVSRGGVDCITCHLPESEGNHSS
jgi:hypothetical protein